MINTKALWRLLKETVSAWIDDYAASMGAAIAYYTMFSVAPLLLIVIAVAGLIFGREAAQGEVFTQLQGLMGNEGAVAVQGLLKSANEPATGTLAIILGGIALFVGATTVFGELQTSLDRIWRAPSLKKTSGLWTLVRERLLSFGMILTIGFLLLVSLVMSAALAAVGKWWDSSFRGWEAMLHVANFVISFVIITVLFAMIYKILPRVRIAWHDVWIGAAVTSVLFAIGKFAIGLYLGKSGIGSGFGAAGSIVVLLVWVYYSAQIFLLGAEFTWVYAYRFGSRRTEPHPDVKPPVPTRSDTASPISESAAAGEETKPGIAGSRSDRRPSPSSLQSAARRSFRRRSTDALIRRPITCLALAVTAGAAAARLLRKRSRWR